MLIFEQQREKSNISEISCNLRQEIIPFFCKYLTGGLREKTLRKKLMYGLLIELPSAMNHIRGEREHSG